MVRKILHVGLHKTGTTTLQRSLKAARRALARGGFHYPSLRPLGEADMAGHHALGRLIYEDHSTQVPRIRDFVEAQCAAIGETGTLFLGTESFYRYTLNDVPRVSHKAARERYVQEMVRAFGADCEIVLTVRRPDSFAMSVYQEAIKKTSQTRTLQEYVKVSQILNMADNIDLFAKHFARVQVLVFEELIRHPKGLAVAVMTELGLETDVSVLPITDPSNVSLHPYLVEYKRLMNYGGFDRHGSAALVKKLVALQASGTLDCLKDTVSLMSVEERTAFLTAREADVKRIAASLGRKRGEVFPLMTRDSPLKMTMTMEIFEAIHAAVSTILAGEEAVPKEESAA